MSGPISIILPPYHLTVAPTMCGGRSYNTTQIILYTLPARSETASISFEGLCAEVKRMAYLCIKVVCGPSRSSHSLYWIGGWAGSTARIHGARYEDFRKSRLVARAQRDCAMAGRPLLSLIWSLVPCGNLCRSCDYRYRMRHMGVTGRLRCYRSNRLSLVLIKILIQGSFKRISYSHATVSQV